MTDDSPPPAGQNDPATPIVIRIIVFLMVTNVLCGFWLFALGGTIGLRYEATNSLEGRLALAQFIWVVVCSLFLIRPLLGANATAWAATESIFMSQAAAKLAETVLTAPLIGFPWGGVVRGILEVLLCYHLFRARGWFGVGVRDGWRVMWRKGWWALVITSSFNLAGLTLSAMALRGLHR